MKHLLNIVPDIHANLYLNAAQQLNLNYRVINKAYSYCKIYNNKQYLIFKENVLSINSEVGRTFAANKHLSLQVLQNNNTPTPNQKHITNLHLYNKSNLINLFNSFKYKPLVLKPLSLSFGTGVYPNIDTFNEFEYAWQYLVNDLNIKSLLIEEHIFGKDYRVLIVNDKIIDVVERIPAFIMGNNQNNINELLNKKNKYRISKKLKPISVNNQLKKYIKKNYNLTLFDILPANKYLRVIQSCNFSQGGETVSIPIQSIHPDNLELFTHITKISHLNFCGIDFITPNIAISYKQVKCAVNEINSSPHQDLHYFANNQENLKPIIILLKEIFNI